MEEEDRPLSDPTVSEPIVVPYRPPTSLRSANLRFGDYDPIRSINALLDIVSVHRVHDYRCDWIVEPEDCRRRDDAGYLPLKGHITYRIVHRDALAPDGREKARDRRSEHGD